MYNSIKDKILNIKSYICISITCLSLAIYVVFFPFIAKLLELINKNIVECGFKKATGLDCYLCGGTRYIESLFDIEKLTILQVSPISIIIWFILFEIIFRIYLLIKIKKKKNIKTILVFDVIIHSIAIIAFLVYQFMFYVSNV